jgi:ABC-type polysaccharide/polyol phosphate export permease
MMQTEGSNRFCQTKAINPMRNPPQSTPFIYDSSQRRPAVIEESVELYRYRDLLWRLVHRDMTVRYKRSMLGFVWTMLNPLLTMLALTAVFSNFFRFDIKNFSVYLLSGTLLYQFIQWGTLQSISSLVWGGALMNKIYLPKTIFIATGNLVSLVNMLLALIPLAFIMLLSHMSFSPALLFLPVSLALALLFSMGISLFVATLAVFFSDVADVYSVAISIAYYVTPIFYPVKIVPEKYLGLIYWNPMYYFVEIFRQPIHQGVLPDGGILWRACLIAIVVFCTGWWFFTWKSDEFAYRV